MEIKALALTANHVDNGVWAVEIQREMEDGTFSEHPHSPFHVRVPSFYNGPVSMTGLVLESIAHQLLRR